MLTLTDLSLITNLINESGEEYIKVWGSIDSENAPIIALNKYSDQNLFEFLMTNNLIKEATIIASFVELFNDQHLKLILDANHKLYLEVIKILCMDQMILLFEDFFQLNTEFDNSLETVYYRKDLASRYDSMMTDTPLVNSIVGMISEYKFLSHPCIKQFYIKTSITTIDSNEELIKKFNIQYELYEEIVPLIQKTINEYYIEYIKYQLHNIRDTIDNNLITYEYYDLVKKFIDTQPNEYIDYTYTDRFGNTMIMYLAQIPILSETINKEIYQAFLNKASNINFQTVNFNGDTVLHIAASNQNEIFLRELLDIPDISEIIALENFSEQSIFDILFNLKSGLLNDILPLAPSKFYLKLTVDQIQSSDIKPEFYLKGLTVCVNELQQTDRILYNIETYNNIKEKIIAFINKITDYSELINDWLIICITTNEIDLFELFLTKFCSDSNKKIFFSNKLVTMIFLDEKIPFIKVLLKLNIDLLAYDETGTSAISIVLQSNNYYIINLVFAHIQNRPSYQGIEPLLKKIAVENQETMHDLFNINKTFNRLLMSLEYLVNSKIYGLETNSIKKN